MAPIGSALDPLLYGAAIVVGRAQHRAHGAPSWARFAPSFLFLLAAALLRHSFGGANAGVTVVTLVPVTVAALHGTRRQLAPVIAGVAAYFVLPVVLIGGVQYPAAGLRSGALYVVVGAMIGYTVQRLVAQVRDRVIEAKRGATPSRTSPSPMRSPAWAIGGRGRHGWTPPGTRRADDGEPLCVAILDLDHFKAYNDANGHPAGDALLAGAALMWRRELRPTDILARYGGEEFAAVLPACTLEGAKVVVERIRAATPAGQTVSAGIAQWDGAEDNEALVARADAALYRAKAAGRDRALVAAA